MKTLIRSLVIETAALFAASQIASGMVFSDGLVTVILTGVALAAATHLVRPIINLLLLPLNMITFGLFKWVSHAVMLYLVTLVVEGFTVGGFAFSGMVNDYLSIPAFSVGPGVLTFALYSLIISFITGIFYWLIK